MKVLSDSDADKMLSAFRLYIDNSSPHKNCLRNHLVFLFLLDAGLRVGELVNLLYDDLFTGQTMQSSLTVNASSNHTCHGRTIPISSRLADCLSNYVNFPTPPLNLIPFDYVFPAYNPHRHISTRQIHRIVTSVGLSACGFSVHPHMLRHTFATRLMRVCPTRIVQELLGHKSLQSTQVYTHPNSDDLRNAIDSM